ncbi:MAG: DUF3810 domain-containing protein [Prevotellaceae bacterium]|jgi:hypothetical protein|nr:DUF3810 domain-containing protein [Prevotellaceae bacterium]
MRLSRKQAIFLSIITGLILFIFLCRWQQSVAEWYMQNIYPALASVLSFISSKIPFSLFDIFITLYVIAFIVSIILLMLCKIKFKKWLKILLYSIAVIFVWFYMAWGISYFRKDFYARTDTPKADFDSTNFKYFLTDYIEELNASYIPINRVDYKDIDQSIESSYQKLQNILRIPYPCGHRTVKQMIYQKWVTKSGVSGYFGPFFNEVHVNRYSLPFEQPNIIAHEKAHQLGVSSEAECNLYAYIVCTLSDKGTVRYSGYFEALGYILSNIRKLLSDEFLVWYNKIRPEIIEDYKASYGHWNAAINPQVFAIQNKVYDTYLKNNKIKTGVANYSEMVALLVSWHNNQRRIK